MTQAAETFSKCQAYKAYAIVTKEPNKSDNSYQNTFLYITKYKHKTQIQTSNPKLPIPKSNQNKKNKTKEKKTPFYSKTNEKHSTNAQNLSKQNQDRVSDIPPIKWASTKNSQIYQIVINFKREKKRPI